MQCKRTRNWEGVTSAIELWQIIAPILTLLGGASYGNWVASRKVTNDDKHQIIESLQEQLQTEREERKFMQKQIDDLYKYVRQIETDHSELVHENRKLEWKLEIRENELKSKQQVIDKQEQIILNLKKTPESKGGGTNGRIT